MNTAIRSDSKSENPGDLKSIAGRSKRSRHRLLLLLGVVLFLPVAIVGVIIAACIGVLGSPAVPLALPEVPIVDLDGADPAIAKLVRTAHEFVEQSPRSAPMWGQFAMVLHAHGFSDAAHICYDAACRLDPKNPTWPYLQGYLDHQGPGGPSAALPHFERAARLTPPGSLAHLR